MRTGGKPPRVLIIGAGMITYDLILPSVYHLQRTGRIAEISVCATGTRHIRELKASPEISEAFPGQDFQAIPDTSVDPDERYPLLYKDALGDLQPRQIVIVAIPDHLHFAVVMDCLEARQHVICVKPLVLTYAEAERMRMKAFDYGLFVGIEYHKRFDRRALLVRRQYRQGAFGEFVIGEAKLIEPYLYRNSNFQNWFTTENSDPFVYIGCHYVDQVVFITGLMPTSVSVSGVKGRFPNGNEAYMWANGRVKFENGALLSVTNGLGYPDDGAGSNEQCITMFCEGEGKTGLIKHNDQFRGISHSYVAAKGPGETRFNFVNPDFFKIVAWQGVGGKPAGYGYDSIEANFTAILELEATTAGITGTESVEARRKFIQSVDKGGLIATPANSSYNELVTEAARISIVRDGDWVDITHGHSPGVSLRS